LQKGAFEAARRAIAKGLSDDVIVDITGLSSEQVQALRAQERPPANGG
jgi:ribosomal protein L10